MTTWKFRNAGWFAIVFFSLNLIVAGTGMFLAIKWHRDQEKKK